MPLQKVALIGANGTLGPAVLSALLSRPNGHANTTVLTRASSKTTYPPYVRTTSVPDSLPIPALTLALRGHDALVMTMAGSHVADALKLAEAAFAAGVRRVIPADFGSCDSDDAATLELLALFEGKKRVRRFLEDLAGRERGAGVGRLSWTSLVTGHFFDWMLREGLLQFDVKKRKALVLDGGDVRFSASNLEFVGRAVVAVLEREEETMNRLLYVQSFCVTQNQVLAALEKATGGKWEVEAAESRKVIEERKEKADRGEKEAVEEIVSVWGIVAANWEGKEGFANGLLGLGEEDLEEVVGRVVKEVYDD
ncbi:NmrA family transcriptional regulator [Lepidopterella palustris CBS 459.81]|uniref:NmrA family transcriptional regulator n=1 Tax=Lepidopterella palustris CBS 459.81 TaxID=1314670 RepID=A0A8E2E8K5_9PEZI|nr:NmrA family transcriptional regulator [Lepidopterella palustris CBS 459.81]